MANIALAGAKGTDGDMEKLRRRFVDELMAQPVAKDRILEIMRSERTDGTWPGIDYADTSRTAFRHTVHLSNLVQMARAYRKTDSPLRGDRELKRAIDLALKHWLDHNYICENWWNNEIGTPTDLTSVMLMMDNSLSKEQIERTMAITARAHINAWGARQSGDRVKIAGIEAKNALLRRDAARFAMLMGIIEGEMRFVPFDQRGLMRDYSFHHRDDRVNNTLSYGLSYADTYVDWAAVLQDTRFRFAEDRIRLLVDYYLDGICRMMVFGKFPDPGATNRDISRPRSGSPLGAVIIDRLRTLADGYRDDELKEIAAVRRGLASPGRSFGAFFWQSEHYTHQRPSYFASVRMFSSRNRNMEEPYNGEGLKNHHRGDGTNYLSLTGNEYFDITPVYDWQKIPGVTAVQKPALPSENDIQKDGIMDFVGAATDGRYGVVGFDFISAHDTLRARKAWFFFDREYVCLGAGISSPTELPVATAIDQRKLEGELVASDGDIEATFERGERLLSRTSWVFHNRVGYIFPQRPDLMLSNRSQTGSWHEVNRQTASSTQSLEMDVFKLWFDHGKHPYGATYSYIVMPATTVDSLRAAVDSPDVEIMYNTTELQAVWHRRLGIVQAVFYRSGELELHDGQTLSVDSPGIVMLKFEGDRIRSVTAADPLRTHSRLHVNGLAVDMPAGEFAGGSATVEM